MCTGYFVGFCPVLAHSMLYKILDSDEILHEILSCFLQVGNSVYYNYDLSVNGTRVKHGTTYPSDYLTDVIVSTEIKQYQPHHKKTR